MTKTQSKQTSKTNLLRLRQKAEQKNLTVVVQYRLNNSRVGHQKKKKKRMEKGEQETGGARKK